MPDIAQFSPFTIFWCYVILYTNRRERGPPGKGPTGRKEVLPGVLKSPTPHLDKRVTMPDHSGRPQQLDNRRRERCVCHADDERVPEVRDELNGQCVQVGVARVDPMVKI